jgi:hypothetical protein
MISRLAIALTLLLSMTALAADVVTTDKGAVSGTATADSKIRIFNTLRAQAV